MKKVYLFFLAVIIILPMCFLEPKIKGFVQKKNEKNTFLKAVSKKDFLEKINYHSKWMEEQIDDDFSPFEKNKITQKALYKTFETILCRTDKDRNSFRRFRIINNKLYMYVSDNKNFSKRQYTFERALRTLCKMIKMPNVDIIYSDEDGTPIFFNKKDFFITSNADFQAPLLSRGKNKNLKYIILIPDYHDLSFNNTKMINKIKKLNEKYPWVEKQNVAFWRGINRKKARYLLSILSYNNPSIIDAGFPENIYEVNQELEIPDIEVGHLKKKIASHEEHLRCKYLPVLDGFFCTYPGYQWRLLSNCVAFKQESLEIQWFYKGLKPYFHYIPIEDDMSDVLEKIQWAKQNDEECKKISENATSFALDNLNIENVYAYLYLLLAKYEKCQKFSKRDLIKDTVNNSNWICIQYRKKANLSMKKRGYEVY